MAREGRVGRVDWNVCEYCEHFSEDAAGTHCAMEVWANDYAVISALKHDMDALVCIHYHERKSGKDFYEETGWDWRTAKKVK